MKRNDLFALLQLCAMPVILMVLGLILLLRPDSAAILVSTVIAWILLCSGVQLFCTGIVGEYLAKTYLEVKHRPIFIVAETEEDTRHGC